MRGGILQGPQRDGNNKEIKGFLGGLKDRILLGVISK